MVSVKNTPEAWTSRAQAREPWAAAMWSNQGQVDRFARVLSHLSLRPGDSLLDYGCGPGRLVEFLPETLLYVGCDWSEGMRDRTIREHRVPAVSPDELSDLVFDHTVVIGTFNLADEWDANRTIRALYGLWDRTRRSLVVSLYAGTDPDCIQYRPVQASRWAQTFGGSSWTLDAWRGNDLILAVHR